MATSRLGKQVLDLEDVTLDFTRPDGSVNRVLDHVTWRLAPGERVGMVGVNGAGKTTLLNLLRGDLEPTSGRVRRGKTVQVATLSQDTHELDALGDMRVVEAVDDVAHVVVVGGKEVTASQMTERMGFTRERAWTRIPEISGGERRRLQLMRLLMSEPNVLLLDEPTNDLDIDTLASMEDLLDTFPGTLVVVSHDRYLLERVTDHQVALLGDGTVRALPGGVEQYLELRGGGGAGAGVGGGPDAAADGAPSEPSDSAARRSAKKDADRIERKLARLRARRTELEAGLARASEAVAADPTQVQVLTDLSAELARVTDEVDEAETAWLEAAEQLD
jgi:ATPase components of ABC transporters with duplicated ATPase domains